MNRRRTEILKILGWMALIALSGLLMYYAQKL